VAADGDMTVLEPASAKSAVCAGCASPLPAAGGEAARGKCPACGLRWNAAAEGRDHTEDIANCREPLAWLRDRLAGAEEVAIDTANGDWPLHRDPTTTRWMFTPRALLHTIERGGGWSAELRTSGWRSRLPRLRCRVRRGEGPAYTGGISLVTLSCDRDAQETMRMVLELAPAFAETVVLFDGEAVPASLEPLAGMSRAPNVKLFARPLGKDFAAQRNAATRLASRDWVLHLDADERPSPAMLAALPHLTALGERHGFLTIGVPRVTLVDGHALPGDAMDDPQYRLHHRLERWVRPVHERPRSFVQNWRRAWMVDYRPDVYFHHLTQTRFLAEKSEFYNAIHEGAGDIDGLRQLHDAPRHDDDPGDIEAQGPTTRDDS